MTGTILLWRRLQCGSRSGSGITDILVVPEGTEKQIDLKRPHWGIQQCGPIWFWISLRNPF